MFKRHKRCQDMPLSREVQWCCNHSRKFQTNAGLCKDESDY